MSSSSTVSDERRLQKFILQNDDERNLFTNPDNSIQIQIGDYGLINRDTGAFKCEGNIYELIAKLGVKILNHQREHPEECYSIDQDALANAARATGRIDVQSSEFFQDTDPVRIAKNVFKDRYGLDIERLQPEHCSSEDKNFFRASCKKEIVSQLESGRLSLLCITEGEASAECEFKGDGGGIVFAQKPKHSVMKLQESLNSPYSIPSFKTQAKEDIEKYTTILAEVCPELEHKLMVTEVVSSGSYFLFLATHKGTVRVTVTSIGTRRDDNSGREHERVTMLEGKTTREKWSLSGDGLKGGRMWSGQAEDDSKPFTPLFRGMAIKSKKKSSSCIIL